MVVPPAPAISKRRMVSRNITTIYLRNKNNKNKDNNNNGPFLNININKIYLRNKNNMRNENNNNNDDQQPDEEVDIENKKGWYMISKDES